MTKLTTAGTNITGPDACANAGRIDGTGAGGRPVAEVVLEDMGRPFNAMRVRVHFYEEAPPVGTKLYAHPPVPSDHSERLTAALKQILAVMGPKVPSCSGCEYEWSEALRIAGAALAGEPTPKEPG